MAAESSDRCEQMITPLTSIMSVDESDENLSKRSFNSLTSHSEQSMRMNTYDTIPGSSKLRETLNDDQKNNFSLDKSNSDELIAQSTFMCKVCGDKAKNVSYGALSCLACRCFFRQCVLDKVEFRSCIWGGNCEITVSNRNNCRYCRYKKCFAVGMVKEEVGKGVEKSEQFLVCGVCGDEARGSNYGVDSCRACAIFFRSTVLSKIKYKCNSGGNCEITILNRKSCQYCRYQKCLAIGMDRKTVFSNKKSKLARDKVNSNLVEILSKKVENEEQVVKYLEEEISEGLHRKSAIREKKAKSPLKCEVCGDKARWSSYGVIACNACGIFFLRYVRNDLDHRECCCDGNSEITSENRNRCTYCRYQKCLAVGMMEENVNLFQRSKQKRENNDFDPR
ncbi:uncharacterized protein B4U79_07059, partial [Dinothrombium tinctorium]